MSSRKATVLPSLFTSSDASTLGIFKPKEDKDTLVSPRVLLLKRQRLVVTIALALVVIPTLWVIFMWVELSTNHKNMKISKTYKPVSTDVAKKSDIYDKEEEIFHLTPPPLMSLEDEVTMFLSQLSTDFGPLQPVEVHISVWGVSKL